MIEVYLTNLGKYNEGDLVGEWITLPMSKAALHEAFLNIGIDGKHYEEYFLTDYESEVAGLSQYIGEYESIDALNCLAEKLSELSASDVKLLESCIELGEVSQLSDVYNVIEHLDDYQLYEDINNDEDLGYYWLNDSGVYI